MIDHTTQRKKSIKNMNILKFTACNFTITYQHLLYTTLILPFSPQLKLII